MPAALPRPAKVQKDRKDKKSKPGKGVGGEALTSGSKSARPPGDRRPEIAHRRPLRSPSRHGRRTQQRRTRSTSPAEPLRFFSGVLDDRGVVRRPHPPKCPPPPHLGWGNEQALVAQHMPCSLSPSSLTSMCWMMGQLLTTMAGHLSTQQGGGHQLWLTDADDDYHGVELVQQTWGKRKGSYGRGGSSSSSSAPYRPSAIVGGSYPLPDATGKSKGKGKADEKQQKKDPKR